MKKTPTEIVGFLNVGAAYLKAHDKADSKIGYAVKKVLKACAKLHETFLEAVEDLRIEHCSVDAAKGGTILRDERGGYVFSKDGLRQFNRAAKALRETQVEIAPHIVPVVPDDLTDDEREAFTGFVLAEPTEHEPE